MPAADTRVTGGRARLLVAYVVLAVVAAAGIAIALSAGRDEQPTPSAAGTWSAPGGCLGRSFTVNQSGEFASLSSAQDSGGSLRFRDGALRGTLRCRDGSDAPAVLAIRGPEGHHRLAGTMGGQAFLARSTGPLQQRVLA